MQAEYQITFGFQYESWTVKVRMTERCRFDSEQEAHRETAQRNIFAFLSGSGILLIERGEIEEIKPNEQHLYEFSVLNDKVYSRLGQPLSPQDIDCLIDEKRLEEVVFSERYMVSEDDFCVRQEDSMVIFNEMKADYPVVELSGIKGMPTLTVGKGFLFESLWYSLEQVR